MLRPFLHSKFQKFPKFWIQMSNFDILLNFHISWFCSFFHQIWGLSLTLSPFLSLSVSFSLCLSLSLTILKFFLTSTFLVQFSSFFFQTRGFKGCYVHFCTRNFKIFQHFGFKCPILTFYLTSTFLYWFCSFFIKLGVLMVATSIFALKISKFSKILDSNVQFWHFT